MIESHHILPSKTRISGVEQAATPDHDLARRETLAAEDKIPSMWNIIFVKAIVEGENEIAAMAQANGSRQLRDR
jgi:hypothetical protein